jgi:hypothetical protein
MGRVTVASALREVGCVVELHDDHFPIDAKDVDWLPEVGRRGWVVLSKDLSIRTNEPERRALLEANVRAFLFSQQEVPGHVMAEAFVKAVRRMVNICNSHAAPVVARVNPSGKVEVLEALLRDWRKRTRLR